MKIVMLEDDDYPLHLTGYASTLPAEPETDDRVEQLRRVVEEVTGKPVEREPKRRIGFV